MKKEEVFNSPPARQFNVPFSNAKRYDDFLTLKSSIFTEDEIDLIEEYFYDKIEEFINPAISPGLDNDYFDDIFQCQNFHPVFYDKDIGSGSWVKVNTEDGKGYNVYWAKKSTKRMSPEALNRKLKRIKENLSMDPAWVHLEETEKKIKLMEEIMVAEAVNQWPVDLKYIKIMKTKTVAEYLLPYQYEIVDDITLYTKAIKDGMNRGSVKFKSYFTSDNKDQIFYLQSRGIDKETAILLSMLKQVYFKVDVQQLFLDYFQPIYK